MSLDLKKAEARARGHLEGAHTLTSATMAADFLVLAALYREAVEALEEIADGAGLEFSDPRVSYETWQLKPGSIERGRAVLAKARAAGIGPEGGN